jgi:hypothetical protein
VSQIPAADLDRLKAIERRLRVGVGCALSVDDEQRVIVALRGLPHESAYSR